MPVACGAAPSCVPRVLTPGSYDEHSLAWSPDGHHIAFVSDRSPDPDNAYTNDLWTVDAETGQVTRLTDTPSAEFWPAWSPDGKQIAFPAWRRTHNTKDSPAEDTHVWAMSAAGGAAWQVAPSLDRRVGQVSWSPAGGSVYFTATDHGSISVYRAPAAGGPAQRLTTCTCQVPQYSLDHAGRWMAYVQNDLTHPSELWIAGADGRGARQLSHEQDSLLARVTMVPSESFAFTSFDGLPVQAWLIKPAGLQPGQRYPLILSIHGGPHSTFGNTFTSGNQILAAHGYGILAINPRGTNGYGQAFSDGSLLNWGGGDYHDLMAGLDTVISHNPWIDTTRMGVTGGSYGGFMTNWIITQTPRFKAAVSLYSVSNLISFYGTSLYTDLIESEFDGLPWDNYPLLWQWSPLAHVAQARTPTLFLHGEVDNDVPVSQGEEMYVALRKQGVPATFALYPGEGHGFHRPAHIQDSLLRLEGLVRSLSRQRRRNERRGRKQVMSVSANGKATLYRWESMPREVISPVIERRLVTGERMMIAHVYIKKGGIVPLHSHDNEQLTYILEGALRLWVGPEGSPEQAVHDVHAGEVLVIPSHLPHRAQALEDTLDVDVFCPPRQDWLDKTDSYLRGGDKR